ncbi:Uncharacterised protein [Mycobacteroides abscessus subsp. abscessus]|nr:Uncharacterised protein [Mycobacteroides abscessus subsp. abscessus]
MVIRLVSWLLRAKCLSEVPVPVDCTPRIQAAASLPDNSGSSL